jgi:hypothetical protein
MIDRYWLASLLGFHDDLDRSEQQPQCYATLMEPIAEQLSPRANSAVQPKLHSNELPPTQPEK